MTCCSPLLSRHRKKKTLTAWVTYILLYILTFVGWFTATENEITHTGEMWTRNAWVFQLVGAMIGVVSCLVILYAYFKYPGLRTHLNTMLLWRTFWDLGTACIYLNNGVEYLVKGSIHVIVGSGGKSK